jgi:hypothetical protein
LRIHCGKKGCVQCLIGVTAASVKDVGALFALADQVRFAQYFQVMAQGGLGG